MIDFQVAFDKLAQFETADELAEFFQYEGIKAVQGDSNNCAISVWMKRTIENDHVFTNKFAITEYPENINDGASNKARTTQPMFDFIMYFDHGLYQELIQK